MRKAAIVAMLALLASLLMVVPALASHPEVSLAGSDFEIDTDANLKVDDPAPSLDWASVTEDQQGRPGERPGASDDSFGQGTKEDTAGSDVVDGSIPNNKSDLLSFGVYLETTRRGRVPEHLLDSRSGADRHDEHGLRVQPVRDALVPTV